MRRGYGWKRQRHDGRDWTLVDPHAPTLLPAKVSLRADMPAVYDQGQLGSCTANAIGAAYEYELLKQHEDFMPSRLWIYYQERVIEGTVSQDAGAEIRDGLKVTAAGVCPESDWPYDISTFAGPPPAAAAPDAAKSRDLSYFALDPHAKGAPLRACIAAGYPFVFGFDVPAAFESLSTANPVLRYDPRAQIIGGHAVTAVGYDFTRSRFRFPVFEVRNSWGADWGDEGHYFMEYNFPISDLWTIRKVT